MSDCANLVDFCGDMVCRSTRLPCAHCENYDDSLDDMPEEPKIKLEVPFENGRNHYSRNNIKRFVRRGVLFGE